MISWPKFEKNVDNQNTAVGDAVRQMTDRALAQSAANARQLQQARAAEAKRQRAESLAAASVLETEYQR